MAKIIVTKASGTQHLVDTNAHFKLYESTGMVDVRGANGEYIGSVKESMEEIQKLINEAEFESTNPKLDLILETLERIEKRLDELGSREVISVEEF